LIPLTPTLSPEGRGRKGEGLSPEGRGKMKKGSE